MDTSKVKVCTAGNVLQEGWKTVFSDWSFRESGESVRPFSDMGGSAESCKMENWIAKNFPFYDVTKCYFKDCKFQHA